MADPLLRTERRLNRLPVTSGFASAARQRRVTPSATISKSIKKSQRESAPSVAKHLFAMDVPAEWLDKAHVPLLETPISHDAQ